MSEEKIAAIISSVEKMRAKGVTGIKIELEAQMNRHMSPRVDGETEYCEHCDEGDMTCPGCDGDGWVNNGMDRCGRCDGDCNIECEECHGQYERNLAPDWRSEGYCADWLLTKIAEKTETEFNRSRFDYNQAYDPFSWMKFARFYNDGSVDSEMTFTVPIDNPENVLHLPKVLEAFKEMSEEIGQGFDVRGAGMHTAVIFSSDCSYPHGEDDYTRESESSSNRIPTPTLRNFKRAMNQLLPALYFLASSNEDSRGLRYRMPGISLDFRNDMFGWNTKYSAISYRYGAMEFRVFDTCYDRPESIFDAICVISNCLRYLSSTPKTPGIERIVPRIAFGNDSSNKLERFYTTSEHLDVLNAGLEKIKPSYVTVSELKRQRNFNRTKTGLNSIRSQYEKEAKIEYQEYSERFDWSVKYREITNRGYLMERVINGMTPQQLRELTPEALDERINADLQREMESIKQQKTPEDRYINDRVERRQRGSNGQYEINFA